MDLSQACWRKSSFSGPNGGNCVEIAELWQKSSFSGDNGGDCVEVAHKEADRLIAVRDSKDPDGPKLFFTPAEWTAFLKGAKANEFDLT
ncbi:DUF397 domain-containing protein [Nonomuraea monospora]|uniref:DUF397 domain-containing protein n=1 Tax=Nonomuraea monospora TaxID=568818 RepID=A0ABN3CA17_9ACTN